MRRVVSILLVGVTSNVAVLGAVGYIPLQTTIVAWFPQLGNFSSGMERTQSVNHPAQSAAHAPGAMDGMTSGKASESAP